MHHDWLLVNCFQHFRPNGIAFTAVPGTSEFIKRWNPASGDIVSFKHRGFMFGSKKPKHPTLFRVRTDVTWEDVVKNFKEHTPAVVPPGATLKVSGASSE